VKSMWHNMLQDMPPHISRWPCHSPWSQMLVSHCRTLGSNSSVIIMDDMVKDQVCLSSWGFSLLISVIVLIRQYSIISLVSKFGASYLS
jgi:hypothetical protein